MSDPWRGQLVRLQRLDADTLAAAYTRWWQDSEWVRLMTTSTARAISLRTQKEWFEKLSGPEAGNFFFSVCTLDDDRLIGDVGLDGVNWQSGESFVGIAIGEREFWNRGYGSDAMRLILRYAFDELKLRRVSLNTFEYNPRAVRSYEKVGFRHEGRQRQALLRDGRRWDILYMGITRAEWQTKITENLRSITP